MSDRLLKPEGTEIAIDDRACTKGDGAECSTALVQPPDQETFRPLASPPASREIYEEESAAALSNELAEHRVDAADSRPKLFVDTLSGFLRLELKSREMVLEPAIPEQGLVMLHAWRGLGKTHVALGMAHAVASGTQFTKWQAPKARCTLYIDGEMSASAIQERLAAIKKASPTAAAGERLLILSADRQLPGVMPNLSTEEGQRSVEELIDQWSVEFLVIDNVATLCRAPHENGTDSWTSMQSWLLKLRRKGLSVLLVHHSGKSGAQRGTSSREDVLDTIITLVRPGDCRASEGCRVEIRYEKARGLHGVA